MKKYIVFIFAAVLALAASCRKEVKTGTGVLSFASMTISEDNEVITKAVSPASGNYSIFIYDLDETLVYKTSYSELKERGSLALPGGTYNVVVRSSEDDVPTAEFEQPVYGASTQVEILAGQTTEVGSITCTLLQTKVTVAYSDDFLAMMTGNGVAKVEVTAGYPLEYELSYNGGKPSYDQAAGYFAVNNGDKTTMLVSFTGNYNGKSSTMRKSFTGIAPKQWRQVKFINKVNEDGTADVDIVIEDYVDDATLNNEIGGNETVIGEDPDAPKGDGGIKIEFDYEAGCDPEFTAFDNIVFPIIPSTSAPTVCLKLKAEVPNGVKKFTVDIESNNEMFTLAVDAADASHLDLINYTPDNEIIFQVVPFPHGQDLAGKTSLAFDLSNAQPAMMIGPYYGVHNFILTITDNQGCKKSELVRMIVNE